MLCREGHVIAPAHFLNKALGMCAIQVGVLLQGGGSGWRWVERMIAQPAKGTVLCLTSTVYGPSDSKHKLSDGLSSMLAVPS